MRTAAETSSKWKTPTGFVGARAACLSFVEGDLYEAGQERRSAVAQQQLEQQAHRFRQHILIASSLIELPHWRQGRRRGSGAQLPVGAGRAQSASASDILWRTSEPRSQK